MTNRDDLYVDVLRYGKANLGRPVRFSEVLDYLKQQGHEFEEFAVIQFFNELFINPALPRGNQPGERPPSDANYYLESRGYFKLLEYDELCAAKSSSRLATWLSMAAIVISVISAALATKYARDQMKATTVIDNYQLSKIETAPVVGAIGQVRGGQEAIQVQIESISNQIEALGGRLERLRHDMALGRNEKAKDVEQ